MRHEDPHIGDWDIPRGPAGLAAMAIVGGVGFTLGQFAFYGFAFLPYWHLIGGWFVGLAVFAAAAGTLLACLTWNDRLGPGVRLPKAWHPTRRGQLAAGILVVLAIVCAVAHRQYQCVLFTAPPLFLIVFAVAGKLQEPIVLALRRVGRHATAFAVVLVMEAAILFGMGEWMAVGHYGKGLGHFDKEKRGYWSISTTDRSDFYVDYARQEIILRTHTFGGEPLEITRAMTGVCK
ncbi:MAG TPA: hypothetical protein VGN55_05870 [Xanthobacteraceae bacterium]